VIQARPQAAPAEALPARWRACASTSVAQQRRARPERTTRSRPGKAFVNNASRAAPADGSLASLISALIYMRNTKGLENARLRQSQFGKLRFHLPIRRRRAGDVFFHGRSVAPDIGTLVKGQTGELDLVAGRDGRPQARNVRLADAQTHAAPVRFGTKLAGDQGDEAA